MKHKSDITRRGFIGGSAATLAGASVLPACDKKKPVQRGGTQGAVRQPETHNTANRSKVVLIRDAQVMDENRKVDAAILASMLDAAVTTLTGQSDATKAWSGIITASDTVGIKTNEWRFLRTPPELEAAIRERVRGAGVPDDHISIRDRQVLSDPVFQKATALINVRPMRTHHWSGVGTCIKNYILFHPSPPQWHDNACENLGGIWKLPIVEGKTRLNILVMLSPLFHSKGPHDFHAEYTWNYNGLIVGFDPVAVDSTGLRVLQAKRRAHFGKDEPFGTPVTHLQAAEKKFGLGHADPGKIDVVKLGWEQNVLI